MFFWSEGLFPGNRPIRAFSSGIIIKINSGLSKQKIGIPYKEVEATDLGCGGRIYFFGLQHFKFKLVESR